MILCYDQDFEMERTTLYNVYTYQISTSIYIYIYIYHLLRVYANIFFVYNILYFEERIAF